MAKRKLTKEERLKRIKLHKISVLIITALGFCGFVVLIILNNVYPDMDNWLTDNGYTIVFITIALCLVQLFINRKWRKNPELYDGIQDERDIQISGIIMKGVVGIYILLSCAAIIVTFILSLLDIITIFVPAIIIGNFFIFILIFLIVYAVVMKKYK